MLERLDPSTGKLRFCGDVDPNDPQWWRGLPLADAVKYLEARLSSVVTDRDTWHARAVTAEARLMERGAVVK